MVVVEHGVGLLLKLSLPCLVSFNELVRLGLSTRHSLMGAILRQIETAALHVYILQ